MKEISSSIQIEASPETVWGLLTDFQSYPEWNPFIPSIEGEPSVGNQLEARLTPPDGMAMTFKPKVLLADSNREFRWRGKLMMTGIFDGEHYFQIEPAGDGVRFTQGERFTGVLVPLMGLMGVYGKTQNGFEAMNEALKSRAEARAR